MPLKRSPLRRVITVLPATLKSTTLRLHKGGMLLPILQLTTGVLTGFASAFGWSKWWLCTVPWMVLNFAGILLSIPVIAFALLAAGTANVEWRTQTFFIIWFIGTPTLLSVIFDLFWRKWKGRRSSGAGPGAITKQRS